MPDTKISALTDGTTPADADEIPVRRTTGNVKLSWLQLRTALASLFMPSKTLGIFTAMTSQPPATNFATLDTRNSIAVLNFDDTAVWGTTWVWSVPDGVTLTNGITARITWCAISATTGNVRWRVKFMSLTGAIITDTFDTATEAVGAANATNGTTTTTSITCTTIASIVAGSAYRVMVERVGSDGTDTMVGHAQLVAVELRVA